MPDGVGPLMFLKTRLRFPAVGPRREHGCLAIGDLADDPVVETAHFVALDNSLSTGFWKLLPQPAGVPASLPGFFALAQPMVSQSQKGLGRQFFRQTRKPRFLLQPIGHDLQSALPVLGHPFDVFENRQVISSVT